MRKSCNIPHKLQGNALLLSSQEAVLYQLKELQNLIFPQQAKTGSKLPQMLKNKAELFTQLRSTR